ncbi:MAG: PAS domain S-box protein [Deltaproteobacteria bacterium]|nr:PAS domain S-box protein [Deltaproteobacteria bacterium]
MEQGKTDRNNNIEDESSFYTSKDWDLPFDAVNDAIWILNQEQRIIRTNRAAELLFNRPEEEMTSKYCWEVLECKGKTGPECPCVRSRISHTRETLEFKRGKDWLQALSDPIFNKESQYTGSVHLFRDITQGVQVREALINSENRYRALFSKMLDGCALHEIICDKEGRPVDYRYLDVNPSFEEVTGFRAKELLGKTALEITPDIDPFLIKTYGKVALTAEPVSFDFFNEKTGRYFIITAYQPEKGQFAIICQNVSEQKKTENALRESEQKFRILEENPIVGIFINQDRKLIYVNDRMAEMHGYTKEEIISQPFDLLVHPDDRASIKAKLDTYLEMGERYRQRLEFRGIKKNRETSWYGAIVTRGKYNGKDAIMGSVIDISESKQAEEELTRSEERYKEIVEETDDLIIKVNNRGDIIFANHMANKIFGLPQSDVIGMHISKCIHPDDKLNTRSFIDKAVKRKGKSTTFENRQVSQTGEIRHLLWTSNFHYNVNGDLLEVTSIARDITQRRKMEEALKKAHDGLEHRVIERTHEIAKANEALQIKTKNLEELNTALKILLDRREKDKEEASEKILLNVKELVIPYISRLKSSPLNGNQKNCLEVLESGLQEITSAFAQRLTSRYMHVTPRELQVGNLVKQGKTSKEIADTLNTTERTVVAHRANLRKKLGLDKSSNLRTYLLSLQ